MIRADLHLHTSFSDGALSPEELTARVADAGVSLFAVTDHDNMEGVERARRAAGELGLFFVRGWEVSSYEEDSKVHVLGYGCKRDGEYERFLKERTEGAYLRAEDSLKKANAYFGFHLTMEDVERMHAEKNTPIHTMHVVRAVSQKLHAKMGPLYREVFSYGKPAYSGLCRPTPKDAIRVIHATGGLAVLAHPGRIPREGEAKRALMLALAGEGLDGIECYYTAHTERESAEYAAFARERGLLVTGGSDFHADGGRRRIGFPGFYPTDALLEALSPFPPKRGDE